MKKNIFFIGVLLVLSCFLSSCGDPADLTNEDDGIYSIHYDGETYSLFDEYDDFVLDENGDVVKQKDENGNDERLS